MDFTLKTLAPALQFTRFSTCLLIQYSVDIHWSRYYFCRFHKLYLLNNTINACMVNLLLLDSVEQER